jgi:hypothetical protein
MEIQMPNRFRKFLMRHNRSFVSSMFLFNPNPKYFIGWGFGIFGLGGYIFKNRYWHFLIKKRIGDTKDWKPLIKIGSRRAYDTR